METAEIEVLLKRLDELLSGINESLTEQHVLSVFGSIMSGKICMLEEMPANKASLLQMLYDAKNETNEMLAMGHRS